jgi:rubredoxin
MSGWRCPICGYLTQDADPPQECPSCRQTGDAFSYVDGDEAYLDELEADDGGE